MKYTNIYTNLVFLLAFQQINCAQNKRSNLNKIQKSVPPQPPKPTNQDTPRLITNGERDEVLKWIKNNKHEEIVNFFNNNNLIDYPLIRFKTKGEDNGYTPLAAAIYHCKINTAKVLAPLQFSYEWTVSLAPLHSLVEIAARRCPKLLKELIESQKSNQAHPLGKVIENLDINQLAQIQLIFNEKANSDAHVRHRDIISSWVASNFGLKLLEQVSGALKQDANSNQNQNDNQNISDGNKANEISSPNSQIHKKSIQEFSDFIKIWLKSSGGNSEALVNFINTDLSDKDSSLIARAAVELIKTGKIDEFTKVIGDYEFDQDGNAPIRKKDVINEVVTLLSASQFASLHENIQKEIRAIYEKVDFEENYDLFDKVTTSAIDYVVGGQQSLSKSFPLIGTFLGPDFFSKVMRKWLPSLTASFMKMYPRLDLAIEMWDLGAVEIIWTGTNSSIDGENINEATSFDGFSDLLKKAYKEDNDEAVKKLLTSEYNWHGKNPDDLRFNFRPYKLSLLKTAVMLNKPKIFKYLMSLHKASFYRSSKHQLTALEMAACYQPDFLLDHILPLISKSCSKRLKAANNVIAMFRETVNQKCPTGAQNAVKILPALMNSTITDEISCIDFAGKEAIEEAFKYDFPPELIMGLHASGKYNNNEFYIELSAKRGNLDLFKYFVSKKNADKPSRAVEEALVTWVRYTNGAMNHENMEMLEFLLNNKDVELNIKLSNSGVSALSYATQRNFSWIVKRLLLKKNLDINFSDLNTLTTPIQHSINIFRNEGSSKDYSSDNWIIRTLASIAKELELPFPEIAVENLRLYTKGLDGVKANNVAFDFKKLKENLDKIKKKLGNSTLLFHQLKKVKKVEDLVDVYNSEGSQNLFNPQGLNTKKLDKDILNPFVYLSKNPEVKQHFTQHGIDLNEFKDINIGKIDISRFNFLPALDDFDPASQLENFVKFINEILGILELDIFIDKLGNKSLISAIPIFLLFIEHLENSIDKIEQLSGTEGSTISYLFKMFYESYQQGDLLKSVASNVSFKNIKKGFKLFRIYLQKVFDKSDEYQMIKNELKKGKSSPSYGLIHNILLSHPNIDTTIENFAKIDTLYLTKRRVTYLVGDEDGFDEMARTHVRVRNIDAVYDSNKNGKRALFGIISTLIIGSASVGMIRWMF